MKNIADREAAVGAPSIESGREPALVAAGSRDAVFVEAYFLRSRRRGRSIVFLTRRALAAYGSSEKDRFLRFVRRMMRSRNRVIRFVGRVSRAGHRYYQKLEDRIDPQERMIKALNFPGALRLWHAPRAGIRQELDAFLRRQVIRHTTWIVVDGIVTVVAILLSPFLVPIPGPNVFFFYPFLRLISHRQALRGARRALRGARGDLDAALRLGEMEALREVERGGPGNPVEGLSDFLKRVG